LIAENTLNNQFSKKLSEYLLRLIGWEYSITHPIPEKCIIVGAPHTSNWDLPIALLLIGASQIKFNWVGKAEVFWWPLGTIMRALGGIPVNRKARNNFVDQIAAKIKNSSDPIRVAITPEGTRSKTKYWKSGFYHMAVNAGVPIVMGYIDYRNKIVGLGPSFIPRGDIQADFQIIQQFYTDKVGLYPQKMSEITLKPEG